MEITPASAGTLRGSGRLIGVDVVMVLACWAADCKKPANQPGAARGLCSSHYNRWRRHGDPLGGGRLRVGFPRSLDLWIDRSGGPDACWPWTAAINQHTGYGMIGAPLSNLAHRAAYLHYVGPIPAGLELDHMCHNLDLACAGGRRCQHRRCCNYERHLLASTRGDNLRRGRGGF